LGDRVCDQTFRPSLRAELARRSQGDSRASELLVALPSRGRGVAFSDAAAAFVRRPQPPARALPLDAAGALPHTL